MKPILGISMGDPSGNGPEISVKALMKPETYEVCRPLIVGDAKCMEAAIPTVKGAENLKVNAIHDVKDAKFEYGTIDVYDMDVVDLSKRLYRKDRKKLAETMNADVLDAAYKRSMTMCGEAAFQYVKKVIELAHGRRSGCNRYQRIEQRSHQYGWSSLFRTYRNLCRLYSYSQIFHDACT